MTADGFEQSDAAYVLGALDPAQQAEFEAHLTLCEACRDRVGRARETVALLGPASEPAPDLYERAPDTLLPAVLRRAARERRRRRIVTAGIAALAAACLVALVVAVRPGSTSGPTAPAADSRALSALSSPTFVSATAALESRPWGTQIDVRCKYAHAGGVSGTNVYGLQVVDTDNTVHRAGTWMQHGEQTVVFTGGTEVRRERIARVQVTRADGTPILQLTL